MLFFRNEKLFTNYTRKSTSCRRICVTLLRHVYASDEILRSFASFHGIDVKIKYRYRKKIYSYRHQVSIKYTTSHTINGRWSLFRCKQICIHYVDLQLKYELTRIRCRIIQIGYTLHLVFFFSFNFRRTSTDNKLA